MSAVRSRRKAVPLGLDATPPSQLRKRARELFSESVEYLGQVARGEAEGNASAVRACDVLGKYGLGEAKVVLPEELVVAIAEVLADDERIPEACIADVTAKLIARLGDA